MSTFIYNYGITDGVTIGMCLCMLLATFDMICYWLTIYCLCIYADIV